MHLDRVFRLINILIAVVIAGVLGVAGWFVWRPMPKASGELKAPVSQPVSVTQDALGVPTIHAANEEDLLFTQGYVTAGERLWQMDSLRRFSAGELSEVIGPATIEVDRESRKLRMRRIAEQAYGDMPKKERAQFAAYARGVNFYLETHRSNLPLEFTVLGYSPQPWSAVDGILIGLYMYRNLTTTWPEKIEKNNLMRSGDPAKIEFLFPLRAGQEIPPGSDVQPGSNAWAVSGRFTATGKPLLSNDMHLEFSVPGIWYMTALEGAGMHVAGLALPGTPGIIVGHNEHVAWGVTNLHFDVQDLYLERLDERTGQYLFQGAIQQAVAERETIRVKGQASVELRHWVTRHGPIVIEEGGQHIALKWTAAEPGTFQFPFLEVNRAGNWTEFLKAVARLPGPGQNFVYADKDGNIGYHASGKLPIRRNFAGDLPVDGASGQFEWDGYIPFEELPSAYNPASGMVVTGNQNPFPANYPYKVAGTFASPYRSRQIRDLLLAKKGLRPADTLAIQKDVYSGFHLMLAKAIVTAWDRKKKSNSDLTDAVAALRGWNGQMEKDQAAPLMSALAAQYLRKAMANVASPGNGAQYSTQMSWAAVARLLQERPAGWFADYDETLVRAFVDAVDECRRMQGRVLKKWEYGKFLQLQINHPIGHRIPLVSQYFDVGPVPMSGGQTSVKQTTQRLGPSERFNADLANWDDSLLNIVVGQSGHVLSPHYKDQWDAYWGGTSFRMPFDKPEVQRTLVLQP